MTRNRRTLRTLGLTLLSVTIGGAGAFAQAPLNLPLSYPLRLQLQNNPEALRELQSRPAPSAAAAIPTVVGPWQTTNFPFPVAGTPANPLLMTDGTVIVHLINNSNQGTPSWYQLTPDITGSYVNGTWSTFASLRANYGPLFHASEVLPDGRVIINGGEYNLNENIVNGKQMPVDTNLGAIYYPSLGAWTPVAPPAPGGIAWTTIGDAQSVVLNDGTYMLANCCEFAPGVAALFSGTPPFNSSAWMATGSGKFDDNDEESWTVLPNGNVLTVDAYVASGTCDTNSEIYNASTGMWSSAGSTIVQLPDCNGNRSFELGPQALRPDFAANGSGDNVIAFGGTTSGTAHTAIFNTSTLTWVAGPNVPSIGATPYTLADAPAATLPSGNVLFAASPSNGASQIPTNFWEVGPNSGGNVITLITQNPDGPSSSSFEWNFLVLPTGEVLAVAPQASPRVWIYTPLPGAPNASWLPVIDTSPTDVHRAFTYQLTGKQFNGLTHGAAYGDDAQANTNYPIVKIVNMASGHVFYERTSGFNTMSVARNTASSTNFTVSGTTETGPSTLYLIANGISSAGVLVTVH